MKYWKMLSLIPLAVALGGCGDPDPGSEGQICHEGFSGENCDQCSLGYFKAPDNQSSYQGYDGYCIVEKEIIGHITHYVVTDLYDTVFVDFCETGWSCSRNPDIPDTCDDGYYGSECKPCPACQNGGVCEQGIDGSGACQCPAAYSGEFCEVQSGCQKGYYPDWDGSCTECPNCGEHGTCSSNGSCICDTGWKNEDYEYSPCTKCAPGYFGPDCQKCDCGSVNCYDGLEGDGTCKCSHVGQTGKDCLECEPGYYGEECYRCQYTCSDGYACNDGKTGDGSCICQEGATATMTDGGTTYAAICINKQIWTTENSRANNNNIYNEKYVNDSFSNTSTYGYLYTWSEAYYACPKGWHLPSASEFSALKNYADENSEVGAFYALMGLSDVWGDYSQYATDEFGFNALPAGFYNSQSYTFGSSAAWWTSTQFGSGTTISSTAYLAIMSDSYDPPVGLLQAPKAKTWASVRCIKDNK